jgi:hypothetical protein
MIRFRTSLVALALTIAIAPAAAFADNTPIKRYHLENAWPSQPAPGALSDIPAPPSPAPSRANDSLRDAGPVSRSTAWHESVLTGDVVAARKSAASTSTDGKYAIRKMPGRPK